MKQINREKIERMNKIKVDKDSDFLFDVVKMDADVFKKESKALSNLRPLYHPSDVNCHLREDVIKPSLSQEEAIKNIKSKTGYFTSIDPIDKYEK